MLITLWKCFRIPVLNCIINSNTKSLRGIIWETQVGCEELIFSEFFMPPVIHGLKEGTRNSKAFSYINHQPDSGSILPVMHVLTVMKFSLGTLGVAWNLSYIHVYNFCSIK